MHRRQFHAGEESQGSNFGNKRRGTEKRGLIGPYFQRAILAQIDLLLILIKSLYVIVLRLGKTFEDHVM